MPLAGDVAGVAAWGALHPHTAASAWDLFPPSSRSWVRQHPLCASDRKPAQATSELQAWLDPGSQALSSSVVLSLGWLLPVTSPDVSGSCLPALHAVEALHLLYPSSPDTKVPGPSSPGPAEARARPWAGH